jgi:Uma2 family endonuclease
MTAAAPAAPASIPAPAVTPDDLLAMGDAGKRYELVDGKLEELNVSFLSSFVAGRAYKALDRYTETAGSGWVVPENTSFQCFPAAGKVRRADTAYIALTRWTAEQASTAGHCAVAPDLVVEVIAPTTGPGA